MAATEEILPKKRVVIVDDHPLLRAGMKAMIDRSAGYLAVGEAGDVDEAIRLAVEERPDLMTMDVSLPGKSGIDAVREIRKVNPVVKILMVSMHSKFEYVAEAFKAGANGYLVKEATGGKLIQALDTLLAGEFYLDGHTSHELIDKLLRGSDADRGIHDERYNLLSPREQQVMRLVAEGVPSRQIAERLDLSAKTVENHRANLMKKLDVHSKMELVRYAAKLGLIDLDQWKEGAV